MSDGKFDSNNQILEIENTLDLLDAVARGESISQRKIAAQLGVALGLANALVKRCISKGLLKVREAPTRRYTYYLTPTGFAEKSRLTAEYLSSSLNFFRHAREEYTEAADYCLNREWRRAALYGHGELSEIAILALKAVGVEPVAIVEPTSNQQIIFDIPVVRSVEEAKEIASIDAVIITESRQPQQTFDELAAIYPSHRIVTPPLLRIFRPAEVAE